MKKQIVKAKNAKYLFTANKPGIGISYQDSRFGRNYDIGTCATSRGRCIITWGLSASREELLPGVYYVQVGDVWTPNGPRENFEAILQEER